MFDDTPTVLRRRAKSLDQDGYNAQFVSVFLRAADELVVRRRCATDAEQEAIEQVGNVQVMKRVLTNIASIVARSSMSKDDRRAVGQNLGIAAQIREPHKKRTILSIEILENQPFDVFLDRVKELYDHHTGGATHGPEKESDEEAEEPSGAGRDADQHPRAEAETGRCHQGPRADDPAPRGRGEGAVGAPGQPGAVDREPTEDSARPGER